MPSALTLVLTTAAAQTLLCMLLAAVLFGFQRIYRRRYLVDWTLSWTFLGLFHVSVGLAYWLAQSMPADDLARIAVSWISLTVGVCQPAWLLFGTYSLATARDAHPAVRRWATIAIPMLTLPVVLATTMIPSPSRVLIRVGTRAILCGLGFALAAWGLTHTRGWQKSPGRRLLALGFAVYSIEQFHHFAIAGSGVLWTFDVTYSRLLGFLDLSIQFLIGLGMVIWHLEEERAASVAAAEALRRSEERLQQSQKMEVVGRLAGGVAHDFNNIITAMFGDIEFAQANVPPGHPARPHLDRLEASAERARSLTAQLLAFSRKQIVEPSDIDLSAVVRGMEHMLRRLIVEDLVLEMVLPEGLPSIRAGPGQIEQIVLNLVVNARDAMPEGGKVRIETRSRFLGAGEAGEFGLGPGEYVGLLVEDQGMGMDEEVKAHLFEPFFTTKPPGEGTGLGLSTVHGIVKQAGGGVAVESVKGRGTTVRMWFPASARPKAAQNPGTSIEAAALSPVRTGEPATILLVEDEPAVRSLVARSLAGRGYTVVEASNGQDALSAAARCAGPIHLLLTDVVMPGLDGFDLAQRLREERSDLRVLFMSGHARLRIPEEGRKGGWLQKPFTPAALVAAVRSALGGGSAPARWFENGIATI